MSGLPLPRYRHDQTRRLAKARATVENMSENERLSMGLSHAGQRIFLETLTDCQKLIKKQPIKQNGN